MIRHIVFFTAKDKDNIDKIIDGLSLLYAIPDVINLEIVRNRKTDQINNDIDVIVYAEFQSDIEIIAYKNHYLYHESTLRVKPLRELRIAADYDVFAKKTAA